MDLLTRSDFDGLACAVLLREIGLIGKWRFVHPKDLQDGHVRVTANDILANVPYVAGCGMWFDHHTSEWERIGKPEGFVGSLRKMDSAARVIHDYFKDRYDLSKFEPMLVEVDKVDAGKLTADDILNPQGWVLLGFLSDPRTGLGRFREFRISNYSLMEELIDLCRNKAHRGNPTTPRRKRTGRPLSGANGTVQGNAERKHQSKRQRNHHRLARH